MSRNKGTNVIKLSLFDRPLASGKVQEGFTFYNHLTFRNIVVFIGVAVLLIFFGNAVSLQAALLSFLFICFSILMLLELSSRRKWEKDMVGQLQHMSADYDRLVRDVARNRNDTASL